MRQWAGVDHDLSANRPRHSCRPQAGRRRVGASAPGRSVRRCRCVGYRRRDRRRASRAGAFPARRRRRAGFSVGARAASGLDRFPHRGPVQHRLVARRQRSVGPVGFGRFSVGGTRRLADDPVCSDVGVGFIGSARPYKRTMAGRRGHDRRGRGDLARLFAADRGDGDRSTLEPAVRHDRLAQSADSVVGCLAGRALISVPPVDLFRGVRRRDDDAAVRARGGIADDRWRLRRRNRGRHRQIADRDCGAVSGRDARSPRRLAYARRRSRRLYRRSACDLRLAGCLAVPTAAVCRCRYPVRWSGRTDAACDRALRSDLCGGGALEPRGFGVRGEPFARRR